MELSPSNHHISYTPADRVRSLWGIAVFFAALILLSPVCVFLTLISAGYLTNFVVEHIGAWMGRAALYAAGVDFSVQNDHPNLKEPCIYIVNHSTTLDLLIFLAMGLPGVRFVAKYELQYNPLFFLLGHLTGQIFIDRGKSEKAIQRLQKTYKRIQRKNLSILMAPEGTRKHEGVIGSFKKGPFRMAMDLGYPIVPIYIYGVRYLNGTRNFWVKKGCVTAKIHPPIQTADWTLDTLEPHISEIRQKYLRWAAEERQWATKSDIPQNLPGE